MLMPASVAPATDAGILTFFRKSVNWPVFSVCLFLLLQRLLVVSQAYYLNLQTPFIILRS